jgi:dCMP deaminase
MLNPQKAKYDDFYWTIVEAAAEQSVATRHKVGAVVVTPTGMISTGWNGMPASMDNDCESTWVPDTRTSTGLRPKTNPEVIHAERNAIDKMTRQGVPTEGSILFISRAPCFECAKALHGLGLKLILYKEKHDDMTGVAFLNKLGVPTLHPSEMPKGKTVKRL